jgi:hypothetical protein
VPAALLLMKSHPRPSVLITFGMASALFVTSKGQHAIVGLVPIGLLVVCAVTRPDLRWTAGLLTAGLVGGMIWMMGTTPLHYQQVARFNLIFYKILPESPMPAIDAAELGLAPSDVAFVGLHSYSPNTPMAHSDWVDDFSARGGYGKVLLYYLRHPGRTLQILRSDLVMETAQRRPFNLSNFRRQNGYPPYTMTTRFGLWTQMRNWLFKQWPEHAVLWYAVLFVGGAVALFLDRGSLRRLVLWAILGVALMGVGEFFVSSLMDGLETYRHLLLFHLLTDITLILVLLYALYPRPAFGEPLGE